MGDFLGARDTGRWVTGGLGMCGNFCGTDKGLETRTFLGDGLDGTLMGRSVGALGNIICGPRKVRFMYCCSL